MKVENLEIGKAYVYKNAECLVLDQLPVWHNNNTYVFVDPKEPQLNIQYLKAEDVNNFITELEIEKPEVPNFRPDHYTSLPFKLDEVQETIAENCFRATGDFKKALWVSFALKHLGRLGLKDDVNLELKKAENYLHKARTGEWIND